jgi:hypothetical protein
MGASVRATASMSILVGMTAVLMAADPPYAGSWKLNPAKSNFGDTTITYENMADGQIKVSAEGQSYMFKTDGKDYPTPWGNTAAWKAVDPSAWEVTGKVNGKVVSTSKMKLAADGKTMTVDSRVVNAAGVTSDNSAVYQRVSGGPGLAGKWQTKNVKIGAPGTMNLSPSGPDGLTLTFVEEKGTCTAKFDGKDHPATGPIWPSGWTCAIAKNGPTAFDVTWKKDGKVMFKDTFTPSPDGKTLTDVSSTPATSEKVTAVYDRQ